MNMQMLTIVLALFFTASLLAPVQANEDPDHDADDQGRTVIPAATATASGIATAIAGPASLKETISLYGRIASTADGEVQVAAPFAGIVRSVPVDLGETVKAGTSLATVQNSDSLQTYNIEAPVSGIVIGRHVSPGAAAGGEPLITLVNLDRVWAILTAFPSDVAQLQRGQPTEISSVYANQQAGSAIDYIAPTTSASQATAIRVVLDNRDSRWRPGQAVTGAVTVAEATVPIAINVDAIQTLENKPVVFVHKDGRYEARPVQLGRNDESVVEVIRGLEPGEQYVSRNSFLVKADLLKSSAADHD